MAPSRDDERVGALLAMIEATTAVFHGLRALAMEEHGPEAVCASSGQGSARGVLCELLTLGPRSVPEMAKRRLVSRQHVQLVVNGLARGRLVTSVKNPAHRRSTLARLTARGFGVASSIRRREVSLLSGMPLKTPAREILRATGVLNALRQALSFEMQHRAKGQSRTRGTSRGSEAL